MAYIWSIEPSKFWMAFLPSLSLTISESPLCPLRTEALWAQQISNGSFIYQKKLLCNWTTKALKAPKGSMKNESSNICGYQKALNGHTVTQMGSLDQMSWQGLNSQWNRQATKGSLKVIQNLLGSTASGSKMAHRCQKCSVGLKWAYPQQRADCF